MSCMNDPRGNLICTSIPPGCSIDQSLQQLVCIGETPELDPMPCLPPSHWAGHACVLPPQPAQTCSSTVVFVTSDPSQVWLQSTSPQCDALLGVALLAAATKLLAR